VRTARWVVVLEVAAEGEERVGLVTVEALMQAVRDCRPAVLFSEDRYAFQLWVDTEGPAEALLTAVSRWREATRLLDVGGYELVRAEVLTPAEFARDIEHTETTRAAPDWLAAEEAAVRTSAQLVTASELSEIVTLVCGFVEELGGVIVPATEAGADAVQLPLGTAIPLAAVAPNPELLRGLVPPVIDTARAAIERVRESGGARRRVRSARSS
jgi:hypothetical protein